MICELELLSAPLLKCGYVLRVGVSPRRRTLSTGMLRASMNRMRSGTCAPAHYGMHTGYGVAASTGGYLKKKSSFSSLSAKVACSRLKGGEQHHLV
jgi:hypothetical protein